MEIGTVMKTKGKGRLPESPSAAAAAEAAALSTTMRIDRQGSLGELAYTALKDALMRGEFVSGTKLTLRSLSKALGVSTTPARDAVNRMIGEGALANLGPKTVVVPVLTRSALDEVTAIRLLLEGLAAERGAPNLSEADIARLELLQEKIGSSLDAADYHDTLRFNKEFHFLIYERSGMPRLVAIIELQWLRIGPTMHDLYPEFAVTREGVSNHLWAIRGAREGDPAAVRAAIENDIRDGYRRFIRRIAAAAKAMG